MVLFAHEFLGSYASLSLPPAEVRSVEQNRPFLNGTDCLHDLFGEFVQFQNHEEQPDLEGHRVNLAPGG